MAGNARRGRRIGVEESLTTTFGSYGQVALHEQGNLVRNSGKQKTTASEDMQKLIAMVSEMHEKSKSPLTFGSVSMSLATQLQVR